MSGEKAVERRWERCRPQQIWDAMAEFPCVYVPSGPLEWHGLQNAIGLDAVKSTAICRRAADRTGGLVFPTVFLGAHEVPMPLGMPVDPDLIEANALMVLNYLARNGARVVIWLGGHGGSEDYLAYRRAALTAMRQADLLVMASVDAHLLTDFEKPMDHAAAIETSIMMYLEPDTVDLAALDPAPDQWPEGVGGDDPRTHASRDKGEHYAEALIDRVAAAARRLAALEDPLERRKHIRCVAQQVAVDDLVVYARANLASAHSPNKTPDDSWDEHLAAYLLGDYDRALEAGSKSIEAARLTTAGRRPAGREDERIV